MLLRGLHIGGRRCMVRVHPAGHQGADQLQAFLWSSGQLVVAAIGALLTRAFIGAHRSLARVGVHFTVPRSVGAAGVAWYGRGPHECYPDRRWGAPLRRHTVDDVAALHVPYIMPGAQVFFP